MTKDPLWMGQDLFPRMLSWKQLPCINSRDSSSATSNSKTNNSSLIPLTILFTNKRTSSITLYNNVCSIIFSILIPKATYITSISPLSSSTHCSFWKFVSDPKLRLKSLVTLCMIPKGHTDLLQNDTVFTAWIIWEIKYFLFYCFKLSSFGG